MDLVDLAVFTTISIHRLSLIVILFQILLISHQDWTGARSSPSWIWL